MIEEKTEIIARESKIKEYLHEFTDLCAADDAAAGWIKDPEHPWFVPTKLALIHSEVSEALEAHRKDLMDDKLPHRKGLEVELADAFIRIASLAGILNLDLAGAALEKVEYNRTRLDHQPHVRAETHGKKY